MHYIYIHWKSISHSRCQISTVFHLLPIDFECNLNYLNILFIDACVCIFCFLLFAGKLIPLPTESLETYLNSLWIIWILFNCCNRVSKHLRLMAERREMNERSWGWKKLTLITTNGWCVSFFWFYYFLFVFVAAVKFLATTTTKSVRKSAFPKDFTFMTFSRKKKREKRIKICANANGNADKR